MIKCNDWPISVCTWSLANDFDKIMSIADRTGPFQLHLGVSPALAEDGQAYLQKVKDTNLEISATMIDFAHEDYSTIDAIRVTGGIVPDEYWEKDRKAVLDAIDLTARLGVPFLTFHLGFIDIENPDKLLDKTRIIADAAAEKNVAVLLETGQETADELKTFFEMLSHPALGINFDPANIILYDNGSPIDALKTLAPYVKHCHIKDANKTATPGTWGEEVPWGTGQVDTAEFLKTLKEVGFTGALAVEREAGDNRLEDIKSAIEKLKDFAE